VDFYVLIVGNLVDLREDMGISSRDLAMATSWFAWVGFLDGLVGCGLWAM